MLQPQQSFFTFAASKFSKCLSLDYDSLKRAVDAFAPLIQSEKDKNANETEQYDFDYEGRASDDDDDEENDNIFEENMNSVVTLSM